MSPLVPQFPSSGRPRPLVYHLGQKGSHLFIAQ
jgi:hypothetical protein